MRKPIKTGDLVTAPNIGFGIVQEIGVQKISLLQADGSHVDTDLTQIKIGNQWYGSFNEEILSPLTVVSSIGLIKIIEFYEGEKVPYSAEINLAKVVEIHRATRRFCFCSPAIGWSEVLELWDSDSQSWGKTISSEDLRIWRLDKAENHREPVHRNSSLVPLAQSPNGEEG